MTLKALLNRSEEITHAALSAVCEKNAAKVFSKVRIADVLKIEGSGASSEEFSFALRAHFDFVIADSTNIPLFAVEFDGPSHQDPKQIQRDRLKDSICQQHDFPILRINWRHLEKKYRNLDLLTWFVEVWFFEEAVKQAQENGSLPLDDYFDPYMVINLPGYTQTFPLWLSAGPRVKIQKYQEQGKCIDFAPSEWTGTDTAGNYHGLMWLRISVTAGVMVQSAMKAQQFPVLEPELLSEILVFDLLDKFESILQGKAHPIPQSEIFTTLADMRHRYSMSHCAGISIPSTDISHA